MVDDLLDSLSRLCGDRPISVVGLARGRNARVWRVDLPDGRQVAAKKYPQASGGGRDRMEAEWLALSFLAENGIDNTPRPLALDRPDRLALYSFLAGQAPVRQAGRLDYVGFLADFMGRLSGLRGRPGAAGLPAASEAALDPADLISGLQVRLARLRQVDSRGDSGSALQRFLDRRLEPALNARLAEAKWGGPWPPLAAGLAILSPSDFGFHNAVLSPGGDLAFVDFEHFGWDDPAKLIVDTMLHPHENMGLSSPQGAFFLDRMLEIHSEDSNLPARVQRLRPWLILKWALILLNEFLEDGGARRAWAGRKPGSADLQRQLLKAELMLKKMEREDS